jgi:uncharacterized protein
MISVDTNILLYSLNADCDEHAAAQAFIARLGAARDVVLCELVLVELFLLLRNPAVVARPLEAAEAVHIVQGFRNNPRWRLVESAPSWGVYGSEQGSLASDADASSTCGSRRR